MNFPRLLCFFAAMICPLTLTVSGGELKTGDAPAWVQWRELALTVSGSANPAGLEYLFYDEQTRVESGEAFEHFAYQIVSQEGLANGAQIKLPFDPAYQSVTLHRLNVWRGGAARDECDAAKFQIIQQERELDRQIYDGRRTALCFLPDVRVGDIVEVALTRRGQNPVYGHHYAEVFFVSLDAPVREQRIRVIPRDGQRLRWRWHGQRPASAREEQRAGGELWWQVGTMPADASEDDTPDWFAEYPYFQITDFQSWAEVAAWALPLYAAPADGQLLQQQAARLEQQRDNAEARAVAAVDFVQKEIRYLGMEMGAGSHRPSPPEVTLARRFGDCKDKALLLTALLRRLGVEAHPVLVNADWRGHLDELLPEPGAFDHVVTLIVSGGKHHLIDATASYQAGSRLADRHMGVYGRGLVVREGETQLTAFELGDHDRGGIEVEERFTASDFFSPVTFSVVTTYRGSDADDTREHHATKSRAEIEKTFREYYTPSYPRIETASPVEVSDDLERNMVRVRETYRIDNFFTIKGKKLAATIRAPYLQLPRVNAQDRRAPLALSYPHHLKITTRMEFPDDWNMTDSADINTPWFHYTCAERIEEQRVMVREQTLTMKSEQVPVEQLKQYLARRDEVNDSKGVHFTRKLSNSGQTALAQALSRVNWRAALTVALALSVSVMALVGWLIYRLTRRPQPPPLPPR